MEEIWKDIKGYEGLYKVSNKGRIKSLSRLVYAYFGGSYYTKEKIRSSDFKKSIYDNVVLSCDGIKKQFYIHRLVAEAFILNIENKKEVNHIDGNKKNNLVSNLEWVTTSENQIHAVKTGLREQKKGVQHPLSKLNDINVREIRKSYFNKELKTQQLADKYKVSQSIISDIINNKKYISI